MATRTIPKKSFSLGDFKEKMGINDDSIKNKPQEYIEISDAFYKATGIQIPKCALTLFRGYSNTGKSTALYETAIACQKQGILPIIIDTENSFKPKHLELMGFDFDKPYIIVDNDYLLSNYGKKWNPKTKQATIEDIAEFCNNIMDKQEDGELEMDICFLWDSIGSLDGRRTVNALENDKEGNNMNNAASLEHSFKYLWNSRLPSTGKVGKKYTTTFVATQKVWLDAMNGAGVVKNKGGESGFYASRLLAHFGGIVSHGTKKLSATKNGEDVSFGIITKVGVVKNHITGISFDAKTIISTPHGFIEDSKESIDEYKKKHLSYFSEILNQNITDANDFDIVEGEEDPKDPLKTMNGFG